MGAAILPPARRNPPNTRLRPRPASPARVLRQQRPRSV